MGNRAVITTRKDLKDIGVYLHWNGGRDSVEGFLTYCKIKGYRPPEYDNYGWAYLCTTIGNFFGGEGFSLGIDVASKLDCDNWDNGTYIIKGWKIVDRLYQRRREQDVYPLMDMLLSIDEKQPNPLGEDVIKAALEKIKQEEIIMKPFKTQAHIHSLDGKMDEITVLEEIGDNKYLVDYRGVKCSAIFNWYNCTYYADDVYGKMEDKKNG